MKTPKTDPLARFTKAAAEDYTRHRLIGMSVGEAGARKTTFWIEGPAPVVVFSMDQGMEGVIPRVLDSSPGKDIRVVEYDWFPSRDEDMQEKAIEVRDKFIEDYQVALDHARTVILDKEGDFWNLYRYAEFGPEGNDAPRNYPALNQRYRQLIHWAKASNANVGFIDGLRDEWGERTNPKTGARGAASTGGRIRSGFKELPGLVHVELFHAGLSPDNWTMTVGKARGPATATIAGETFGGLSFAEFGMLVFPDSDEESWL